MHGAYFEARALTIQHAKAAINLLGWFCLLASSLVAVQLAALAQPKGQGKEGTPGNSYV
jgi:hypothetical protein